MDELRDHPLHRARGVFTDVSAGPGGKPGETVLQVRTPAGPARTDRLAPRLGEQSREVLAEYGFTSDEISTLAPG
jgi:crotonobetainyl-CoA:carnitine CoA-transferase CaiB-like acyl-CoA transferase